jgi:lipopolysaccharide/colanic/teichoic acid biosynthesis glycosyltransferase
VAHKAIPQQMTHPFVPGWKRTLDLVCILLAAPLLLAISAVIAAGIKLVSSGPVLFKQDRIGLSGRRFTCLKFRTMLVNADTGVHEGHLTELITRNRPLTKLDLAGDPRLLPGGRVLRALGLDELPQVLNIWRGEMSLVGPRPCMPYEYERYSARHRRRFETLPGLTGLWQVSGKNHTTFEEMIDLDISYVERKSLLLDIKIILKTIPAIIVQVSEAVWRRIPHRRGVRLAPAALTKPLDKTS